MIKVYHNGAVLSSKENVRFASRTAVRMFFSLKREKWQKKSQMFPFFFRWGIEIFIKI
jgi:hypothetical protein